MKIEGRIIQDKYISVNTEGEFSAVYKAHVINVKLHKKGHTNEYDINVRHFNGSIAANTYVNRCNIRDAIIYALEGSLL